MKLFQFWSRNRFLKIHRSNTGVAASHLPKTHTFEVQAFRWWWKKFISGKHKYLNWAIYEKPTRKRPIYKNFPIFKISFRQTQGSWSLQNMTKFQIIPTKNGWMRAFLRKKKSKKSNFGPKNFFSPERPQGRPGPNHYDTWYSHHI